ncbi:MAG: hypothetical protein M3O26_18565 [Pseudomonadota bacterium]|nr:hypothetical protein [Pseudomonadota bacterium]
MSNVLILPDLQIPFHHPRSLEFLQRTQEKYKCDTVICVGDETDNAALSKFPKDPDGMSGGDELKAARAALKPFIAAFPKLRICESNHRQRLYKRAFEAGIPADYIASTHAYLDVPKTWRWAFQHKQDGVVFEHGDRGKPVALNDANGASTVFGHHHTEAGIWYVTRAHYTRFAFNVGSLIDINAYAFKYSVLAKRKPVLS